MAQKKSISFKQVLSALLDMRQAFPPSKLHQFSDLNPDDVAALKQAWSQVHHDRKISLLEDLEMIAESDTLVNFDELSKLALSDLKPEVRIIATRLLWECTDPKLIPTFLDMVEKDSDEMVRATVATALGQYVYLGEIEEISELMMMKVVNKLLAIVNGSDKPIVRRRALESLGYTLNEQITSLLKSYITSDDPEWVASALFGMGRSLDQVWTPEITRYLSDTNPQIQLEAVRAAGNLELEDARETLIELLGEEDLDEDIRMAIIWSLSQIGGGNVRALLEELFEQADDEEAELIEEALDNLAFTEAEGNLSLFEIDAINEDESSELSEVEKLEPPESDDSGRKRHKPKK